METINLNPKEPVINGKELSALIDMYLDQCSVEAYTLTGYRNSLNYALAWWKMYAPANDWRLTPTALRLCAKHLQDIGLSLNTRKAIHIRLRSCFRWAYRTGRITLDVASWIPMTKGYTEPRQIAADVGTFQKLYQAADKVLFPDRARALLKIREDRLYRLNYATFEEYCQERWGLKQSHAYRIMDASSVVVNLKSSPMGELFPATERVARPLTSLPVEDQPIVWQKVVESAPNGRVTATCCVDSLVTAPMP